MGKRPRPDIAAGKKINYEGASGPLEFDENGDVPEPSGTSSSKMANLRKSG